jgi:hypothetical protein
VTRAAPFVVAGAAAFAAIVLLLLGLDVRRVAHQVRVGDAAGATELAQRDVWRTTQVIPFGAGRALVGLDDDLRYRRALRLFVLGKPNVELLFPTRNVSLRRAEAEASLARLARSDADLPRRSRELNMLGILGAISVPPSQPAGRGQALLRAALSFRNAIVADESDLSAKYNLELTLRQLRETSLAGGSIRGLGGAATQSKQFGTGY